MYFFFFSALISFYFNNALAQPIGRLCLHPDRSIQSVRLLDFIESKVAVYMAPDCKKAYSYFQKKVKNLSIKKEYFRLNKVLEGQFRSDSFSELNVISSKKIKTHLSLMNRCSWFELARFDENKKTFSFHSLYQKLPPSDQMGVWTHLALEMLSKTTQKKINQRRLREVNAFLMSDHPGNINFLENKIKKWLIGNISYPRVRNRTDSKYLLKIDFVSLGVKNREDAVFEVTIQNRQKLLKKVPLLWKSRYRASIPLESFSPEDFDFLKVKIKKVRSFFQENMFRVQLSSVESSPDVKDIYVDLDKKNPGMAEFFVETGPDKPSCLTQSCGFFCGEESRN
ncbi:MAG: hypothetical protein CL678_00125 [Bdellovibrionaceae bacterium]|nr:hypothetical protein [Pseudobdellovibrionaceae bacterium]|tara:strand:- start:5217 stop:6233 length:1017 start_codon:yes stop_codon:yes gene_type:complete